MPNINANRLKVLMVLLLVIMFYIIMDTNNKFDVKEELSLWKI
jgi:hypothetical protein